jgi:hypothetical protein
MFHQEFCICNGFNYKSHEEDKTISMDPRMLGSLGVDKAEVYKTTYSHISQLEYKVSHPYRCIIVNYGCHINTQLDRKT